ncbi:hypothetical protein HDU79_008694 [Rhizoclosmatium sp. JEL0117]|nr:hypothetical protein HDU79_008694 [Rhizoclosmatium sp. JEL0117]
MSTLVATPLLSPTAAPSSPPRLRTRKETSQRLSIMISHWNSLQHSPYSSNDRAQLCRTLTNIYNTGKCDTLNPYGQDEEDVFYACYLFLKGEERGTFLDMAKECWKEDKVMEEEAVFGLILGDSSDVAANSDKKQRDSALCLEPDETTCGIVPVLDVAVGSKE